MSGDKKSSLSVRQTFVQEIGHDIVTASDDFGKRAGSFLNQTLGIACPDIGSMGKTRDDDQIAEAFRPGMTAEKGLGNL